MEKWKGQDAESFLKQKAVIHKLEFTTPVTSHVAAATGNITELPQKWQKSNLHFLLLCL